MGSIGALGIGLSVIFGAFVVLLLAELYYMFCWKSQSSTIANRRVNDVGLEYEGRGGGYARDAAFVGSFGGYSGSPLQSEFVAKFLSLQASSPELKEQEEFYIPGMLGPPRLLFTIKEETKEDMESEDPKRKEKRHSRSRSRTPSDVLAQFSSGSSTPSETPFATPPTSPSFDSPAHPLFSGARASPLNGRRASSLTPFAASAVKPAYIAASPGKQSRHRSPGRLSDQQGVSSSSSSTKSSCEALSGTSTFSPQSSPPTLIRTFPLPSQNPFKESSRTPLKALFERSPLFEGARILSPTPKPFVPSLTFTNPLATAFIAGSGVPISAGQRVSLGTLFQQPSPALNPPINNGFGRLSAPQDTPSPCLSIDPSSPLLDSPSDLFTLGQKL